MGRGAQQHAAPLVLFRPYISLYTYAPTAPATAYSTSATIVPTVYIFCGNSPIGASPSACSRPTKNHTATPAMTAVLAPAPNRGRIAAYTHSNPMPVTKSSTTNNGTSLSIAPGCLPSACIAAAIACFIITPKTTASTTLRTTPASTPPTTTRPQLILPMCTPVRGTLYTTVR